MTKLGGMYGKCLLSIVYANGACRASDMVHGAYIGTLGLMECKKYVLYVIRKR